MNQLQSLNHTHCTASIFTSAFSGNSLTMTTLKYHTYDTSQRLQENSRNLFAVPGITWIDVENVHALNMQNAPRY